MSDRTMSKYLVSVENLAIDFATNFGEVNALRGVSFALKAVKF